MDQTRTGAVMSGNPHTTMADPATEWSRYALDSNVLCIRDATDTEWQTPADLTFRDWINTGAPTLEDLDYHLTTLFPPVRPRGYLEMRMIDAQRGDGWIVPLAVCATLLDNPMAGAAAMAATEALWARACDTDPWRRAAQAGLEDRVIAAAAKTCFLAVVHTLPTGRVRSAVETFVDQYVGQGRCPGDDMLDEYQTATTRLIA